MIHKKAIAAAVAALFSLNIGVVNAMPVLPAAEDVVVYGLLSLPFKIAGKVVEKTAGTVVKQGIKQGTKGKLGKIEAVQNKAKKAKKSAHDARSAKNKLDDIRQRKNKNNDNPFGSKEKSKVKNSQTQKILVDPEDVEPIEDTVVTQQQPDFHITVEPRRDNHVPRSVVAREKINPERAQNGSEDKPPVTAAKDNAATEKPKTDTAENKAPAKEERPVFDFTNPAFKKSDEAGNMKNSRPGFREAANRYKRSQEE